MFMQKILIVDDMPVNRKLMKKVLSDTVGDITFIDAEDGFQALECLDRYDIDLVILDLMMPGKDGFEVLADMRKNLWHRDIPVIVNSAISDMESIKKTLELGAMDYFTKPITPEQMKVIIPLKANNALKFYEQRKKLKEINRRMENELKIASILQRSLIKIQDDYQRIRVYQKYMACDELGGDLFDLVEMGAKDWFMIADITGHGVAASLVASMLKVVFNHAIQFNSDPAAVLEEINSTFFRLLVDNTDLCFSVFVGLVEGDTITFANAGHPYPILITHDPNEWKMLETNGFLIGLMDDTDYENRTITWNPGEAILTYTDGMFENPQEPEEMKGFQSVILHARLLEKEALNHPESFMDKLLASFGKVDLEHLDDDIAMMYMIRKKE
jgi:phosphoserine phosphatase RsbU/P